MKLSNLFIIVLLTLSSIACAQDQKSESTNNVTEINNESTKVQKNSFSKITMVELGSVNCVPCRAMERVMDSLEVLFPTQLEIKFYDVWTEAGKPYGKKYNVRIIPTQVFLDENGDEIHRHHGFYPQAEIITFLESKGITK